MKGYALIEIIIVVAIIVLFSALSLGYYRNFDEQKKLDGEIKQFTDVLDLASSKSSSGDLSPNPSCVDDFQGYGVQIINDASYSFRFNCGGVYTTIQTYTVRPGLTLLGAGTDILFKPLTAETNLGIPTDIIFTSSTINKCIRIQISPQGVVEEMPTCP